MHGAGAEDGSGRVARDRHYLALSKVRPAGIPAADAHLLGAARVRAQVRAKHAVHLARGDARRNRVGKLGRAGPDDMARVRLASGCASGLRPGVRQGRVKVGVKHSVKHRIQGRLHARMNPALCAREGP